jgi:cell division control protein 24
MPPIPNSAWTQSPTLAASSSSTLVGGTADFTKRMSGSNKRSSGDSQATEVSESSSQSPATPYDVSRQNSQDAPMMLVRIQCGDDQFAISVHGDINYHSFYSKVNKKVRMCAKSSIVPDSGVQMIKWVDADNDEITIRCDADLEAMFGECRELRATSVNIIAR